MRGEVSGLNNRSGRLYFDLKEQSDVLRCVVWAGDAVRLAQFKDGDEIICGGEYGTYAQRSQYQLFVKSVELTGIGALYAQFEALKERFRKEGLFEKERKRALPAFPRRIAVVSARGKGAEDFLATIAKRAPFVQVVFVETRVQGDGAQMDIGEAIFKASKLDVDVIVLTRGGGSYEDLFPFNLEPVVRAIVRSAHPVLSAIGHTGDVHVSDYVADHSCETPSNAAQYFGEIGDRFLIRAQRAQTAVERIVRGIVGNGWQRLDMSARDLRHAAQVYVSHRQQSLLRLERRLNAQTPQQRLAQRRERLTELRSQLSSAARYHASLQSRTLSPLTARLSRAHTSALGSARERLKYAQARLAALDPHAPLERGYAIVGCNGKAVRDAAAVAAGAQIHATVQRGKLVARVERAFPND